MSSVSLINGHIDDDTDLVEVVRCKNCGHYNGDACVTLPCSPVVSRKPDDYCSYGKRRDKK